MINFEMVTKDPEIGKKLLIGSLLVLTGIGIFAILGWMLEIMRAASAGKEPVLPDFDNIGENLVDGLKASAVALIWSLPLALVITLLAVAVAFIPTMFASADDAVLAITLLSFCIVGVTMILVLPLLILLMPALGILAETGSIREALSFKKVLELARVNLGGFALAGLLGMFINSILGSVGVMLCLIGFYPATVVSYAFQGQLYGRAYADAKANLSLNS